MSIFSLDNTDPMPVEDPQAKVLNNALRHFCDKIEQDDQSQDEDKQLSVRDVIWHFGSLRFRAKLATLAGQFSSGEYFFSTDEPGAKWKRLPTPRALAEKLIEARDAKG
jgi:hypothetical protein